MRALKNVRVVAEQPTDNAPSESLKVGRALFQPNTSSNQGVFDICLKCLQVLYIYHCYFSHYDLYTLFAKN